MSFLDKMKAKAGVGSAVLEVDVQQRPTKRGEVLRAAMRVRPGATQQKLNYLRVSFEYYGKWYVTNADGNQILMDGKAHIWYGEWEGSKDIALSPGNPATEWTLELVVPSDAPPSSAELKYKFFVRADIESVKDPEFSTHFDITA